MQTWALLLLLLIGVLRPDPAQAAAAEPRPLITLTDVSGRPVQIRVPVRRLVTTNGAAAEVICALGGADTIVGLSDYSLQHHTKLLVELRDRGNIGSATNPDVEKIIALQPEVVIVFYRWMAPQQDLEAKLAPLGITVVRLNCFQLATLPEEIVFLGKILGQEERAAQYQEEFRRLLALTTSRTAGVQPVRVYMEGFNDYTTSSSQGPDHELFTLAGMKNIAAALPVPLPKVSAEWVVAANPAVIIKTVTAGQGGLGFGCLEVAPVQRLYEQLKGRPAWRQIDAVQRGRVHLLASEIKSSPRLPIGLLYQAKWCHPECFRDLDPEEIHRQWLQRWHKRELQGIFTYP